MKIHTRLAAGLNLAAALTLSGCLGGSHPATPSDRVITVQVPVAVQPITKAQIPALPGQLGPRPDNASDAADQALAGRCEAIAFVLKAWPLLLLSAGQPLVPAPDYPECDRH